MATVKPLVVTHRSSWAREAANLIALLQVVLGDLAVRIDHIGSTAIPLMASKDLIDLQVSVPDLEIASQAFEKPLNALGFQLSPFKQDHVPAGRTDDRSLWSKRLFLRRTPLDSDINLHVRRVGSSNERLALLFRDWFRAHPEAVPAYGSFKQALAEVTEDTDVYSDIKDPIVDVIVVSAEDWAMQTGWRP